MKQLEFEIHLFVHQSTIWLKYFRNFASKYSNNWNWLDTAIQIDFYDINVSKYVTLESF